MLFNLYQQKILKNDYQILLFLSRKISIQILKKNFLSYRQKQSQVHIERKSIVKSSYQIPSPTILLPNEVSSLSRIDNHRNLYSKISLCG